MTILRTTSEDRVRTALLDVLHAQWHAFGVPFDASLAADELEVIDPEALLWCSLEFAPLEARLDEGIRGWLAANRTRLNRQRLNKWARAQPQDLRAGRWRELEAAKSGTGGGGRGPGRQAPGGSTLLLRSRDVLGNDCRSFLIVLLLGHPRGLRLRNVAAWTGYAYRSVAEAAAGWERAGIVRVHRGHCILPDPSPWRRLLGCGDGPVVTIDWHGAYDTITALLRTLADARARGFDADHPLVALEFDLAIESLERCGDGAERRRTPALERLRAAVAPRSE